MLMAVLEGRTPARRPHHAVEVAVTPSSQPGMEVAPEPRGALYRQKIYVHGKRQRESRCRAPVQQLSTLLHLPAAV